LIENIKIGDRVEIRLKRDFEHSKPHISQVENRLGKDRVVMHMPISYGKLVELSKDSSYRLLFFTEKGLLRFDGIIEDYMNEDGFALMIVHLVSEGEKIQRRDFFRFSCVLPVKFSMVDDEAMTDETATVCQGIVKDIGGGGICFLTNESMDEGKFIKCVIKLDSEVLVVIGEVLQKHFFPKSNYRYQYRIGFVGILPAEQEKIVQFIFNEQKRLLQRLNR
jgi:c-di-GMP-binding flagellar brake protein YcgR